MLPLPSVSIPLSLTVYERIRKKIQTTAQPLLSVLNNVNSKHYLYVIELFNIAEEHRVDLLNVDDGFRHHQLQKLFGRPAHLQSTSIHK